MRTLPVLKAFFEALPYDMTFKATLHTYACTCAFTCAGKDNLTDRVDLIICLGGDGTLLYASTLFQVRNLYMKSIQDSVL